MNNNKIDITRIAEPKIQYHKNIVDVNYHLYIKNRETKKYFEINEKHSMRHFSIPEIEYFAKVCNFQMLNIEEYLTGKQPSNNTWGVCFVFKKKR